MSDGRLLPHLTQRRWQRLDDLLEQALAQLPEQRRAFVESACADDPNLRTALERLIEADARNSGFLEPGLARLPEEPDLAGLELGPWRLVTRIGQGGMGSVYCAVRVDGQFEQHVAVKMMRRGLADPGARARFAHEQRVLASLQHPGIARLLDAGRTPDGRPYLVMEHVDGRPIDVYCRERALPVEGRLRLFLGVADAVEHAHGSLLVHRDIKPGNVLVTADGRTKLLDFGIAKQLETGPVDLTPTAHPLMTPGYASPEQVRGELVTTVSDVYSLGVLLYELLCGQPPFGGLGESPFELARAVLEREPPKPSARAAAPELRRRLRGDIDAIVMKALRKEPAQRYASVALLTQDVAAHLAGQPVAARRGGWSYRTGKLLRRHRWVAAGLLLALALGAGLVSRLVSQGRQLAQERDKAQAALAILLETFTRSDPYAASDEPKVRDLLDRGAARALDELEHRPRVAGPLLGAIGRAYLGLGLRERAEPLAERWRAVESADGDAGPGDADSLELLGELRVQQGRAQAAEAALREALAIRDRLNGPRSVEAGTLARRLGQALEQLERFDQAESELRRAVGIHEQAGPAAARELAEDCSALARLRFRQARFQDAAALHERAVAVYRTVLGERSPQVGQALGQMATAVNELGQGARAEALLRQALAIQEARLGPTHPDSLSTRLDLATAVLHQSRLAEAEELYRDALQRLRQHLGWHHPRVSLALRQLGVAVQMQRRDREALAFFEQSLAVERERGAGASEGAAEALVLMARSRFNLGAQADAIEIEHQALEMLRGLHGENHPAVASTLTDIGQMLMRRGRAVEAETYFRRGLAIRGRVFPSDHPELAFSRLEVGGCLTAQERFAEAEPLLRAARDELRRTQGLTHVYTQRAERKLRALHEARDKRARRTSPDQQP